MNRPARVPLIDLRPDVAAVEDELLDALQTVVRSGRYILGPNVVLFETDAAAYLGCKHAVGVNSGTDALSIALRCLGVGAGDEVITTPFTFVATAEAIASVGAVPVFADIDPKTFNLDPAEVERCLTRRTKAVVPVHVYGHAADLDAIVSVVLDHGVAIVEDAAQAFGAELHGRKLGTVGDVGAFSFYPSKPLGGLGDGGLIVTDDDLIARDAKVLREHGLAQPHGPEVVGYNSRLDELQAAVLRVKLHHIDALAQARRRAANRYTDLLATVPSVQSPIVSDASAVHLYTVRVLDGRRDDAARALGQAGIETATHYSVLLHRAPAFARPDLHLPEAERAAQEVLCLPLWPSIPDQTIDEVVHVLANFLR